MPNRTIAPEVITYTAAISASSIGGQPHYALTLLNRICQPEGLAPNVITYNAAISSCVQGLLWEQALWLLRRILLRRITPDALTYSAAISTCEGGRQPARAMTLFDCMQ